MSLREAPTWPRRTRLHTARILLRGGAGAGSALAAGGSAGVPSVRVRRAPAGPESEAAGAAAASGTLGGADARTGALPDSPPSTFWLLGSLLTVGSSVAMAKGAETGAVEAEGLDMEKRG